MNKKVHLYLQKKKTNLNWRTCFAEKKDTNKKNKELDERNGKIMRKNSIQNMCVLFTLVSWCCKMHFIQRVLIYFFELLYPSTLRIFHFAFLLWMDDVFRCLFDGFPFGWICLVTQSAVLIEAMCFVKHVNHISYKYSAKPNSTPQPCLLQFLCSIYFFSKLKGTLYPYSSLYTKCWYRFYSIYPPFLFDNFCAYCITRMNPSFHLEIYAQKLLLITIVTMLENAMHSYQMRERM